MSTQTPTPSTPPSLAAQIAELPRCRWQTSKRSGKSWSGRYAHPQPPVPRTPDCIPTAGVEFRKVDANLLDRNQRRIASLVKTGKVKKRDRDYRPAAGTVLVREYKGSQYRVIATADGQYEFQGRMYPSLSMIAREITGVCAGRGRCSSGSGSHPTQDQAIHQEEVGDERSLEAPHALCGLHAQIHR